MEWGSKFNDPKESSGFLLWQVTQAWQRFITKELNKIDLTHAQFVLLTASDYLHTHGENVTQKKLAEFTKTNIMMVSDVVRTLETKGFLLRNKNPLDKREILLSPTEEGSAKVKMALPIVENVDEQFFSSIKDKQNIFNEVLLSLLTLNTHVDE
ncbi:MarR family winged helix-turn-helix transcriptional regulator [Neobacillus massiliamazoniensis]|jgi:DNA-binding MarR family transcriptional regulator|uniref:Transcriptional regulator n=1 Tax=Neobacillus massiliamazoniensis TaxID=1499688 RepID=A0A0U1NTG7_9BACI|nr:MarR family transcriptional regulator [Neobacillus massiliamazoniensis]CRK81337.1 transcriptional regulator [Neobacillus massiliamazoniensis]